MVDPILPMPLKPVSATFESKYSVHDSWSELYVGIRRLVYSILPPNIASQTAEDAALCQLVLVGSSTLVEIALYKLLLPFATSSGSGPDQKELENAGYFKMLALFETGTKKPLNRELQPIKSTEALRKRRNETIHKTSALATVPMARAALFSAVEACRHLYLIAGSKFPYESFLIDDPIPLEAWFSDVPFPPST